MEQVRQIPMSLEPLLAITVTGLARARCEELIERPSELGPGTAALPDRSVPRRIKRGRAGVVRSQLSRPSAAVEGLGPWTN